MSGQVTCGPARHLSPVGHVSGGFRSSDLGSRVLSDLPQLGGASALLQKQRAFVCFICVSLFYSFLDVGLRSADSQAGLSGKGLI